jgi:hypothetical protein
MSLNFALGPTNYIAWNFCLPDRRSKRNGKNRFLCKDLGWIEMLSYVKVLDWMDSQFRTYLNKFIFNCIAETL